MGRIHRVVAEGVPHHITQRGNARQVVFEDQDDRLVYLKLLRGYTEQHKLLLGVVPDEQSRAPARCAGNQPVAGPDAPWDTQRLRTLSERPRRQGRPLWQARYYSCPVDEGGVW